MESMNANNGAAVRPGAWLLAPRTALTLQPASTGRLQVWDGGLWATFDGPHDGPANDRGDRLLQPGDALTLRAGERLVIERLEATTPARFTWDPMPDAVPLERPARAASTKERPMRSFHSSPAFTFLGWCAPAPLARLLLALAACGLTATLWLGAAAASSEHRIDASASPAAAPQPQDVRTAGCAAPPAQPAPA